MQRRLLLVLGILGALAGFLLILALYLRPPPRRAAWELVQPPPARVAPTPDSVPRVERQGGTLKGRVIHGNTGVGISGAKIVALKPYLEPAKAPGEEARWGQLIAGGTLYSREKGEFETAALAPDYWNLWVEKKGFAWTTVPRAKFDEEHEIKLYPGCKVRGKVVYPDGFPAPNVRIEYHVQGTHSEVFSHYKLEQYVTATGKDGTFLYEDMPPGKFTVEVYPPDHMPAPWRYEPALDPGEDRDLGVHKLDDGHTMNVRVVWRETNAPVPDVEVVVRPLVDPEPRTKTGQHRRTGADGIARFKGLGAQSVPNPKFKVVANLPSGAVPPDESEMFAPGSDVTIRLRKDGIVKGQVVRPNGDPLDQFFVDLEPKGHITQQLREAGANGAFAVYQVPSGTYVLHVRHGNLVDRDVEIEVVGGQELDVGVIRLEQGAEISGVVRRSNGKELDGVVRVNVGRKVKNAAGREAWEEVGRAYAQQNGDYAVKGLPAGVYGVWPEPFKDPTGTTEPVEVTIGRDDQVVRLDLTIWAEGLLNLRFFDHVEGGVKQVIPPPTYLVETATGKEIRWFGIGTRLRPGSYTVFVEMKDKEGVPRRYKAREVAVTERLGPGQDDDTRDPIEVRLFEIRDGN